jgi:hypothetical protein
LEMDDSWVLELDSSTDAKFSRHLVIRWVDNSRWQSAVPAAIALQHVRSQTNLPMPVNQSSSPMFVAALPAAPQGAGRRLCQQRPRRRICAPAVRCCQGAPGGRPPLRAARGQQGASSGRQWLACWACWLIGHAALSAKGGGSCEQLDGSSC